MFIWSIELLVRFLENFMFCLISHDVFLARHENVSYCISVFFFVVFVVVLRTITRDAVFTVVWVHDAVFTVVWVHMHCQYDVLMQYCISTTIFTMILNFCQIEVLGGTRSTNEKKIGNFFSQKFVIQIFKDWFLYNYLSDWCEILTKYSLRRGEPNLV